MGINDDSAGANQVKLTALQLFRKILIVGGPEDQDSKAYSSRQLDTFLPFILKSLTSLAT
jgi:hypothetical protein